MLQNGTSGISISDFEVELNGFQVATMSLADDTDISIQVDIVVILTTDEHDEAAQQRYRF